MPKRPRPSPQPSNLSTGADRRCGGPVAGQIPPAWCATYEGLCTLRGPRFAPSGCGRDSGLSHGISVVRSAAVHRPPEVPFYPDGTGKRLVRRWGVQIGQGLLRLTYLNRVLQDTSRFSSPGVELVSAGATCIRMTATRSAVKRPRPPPSSGGAEPRYRSTRA